MASEKSGKKGSHRTCSICLEPFRGRAPKILSCFHTFCSPCLTQLVEKETKQVTGKGAILTCPTCRTCIPVPPGGVKKLQSNFYLVEAAEHAEDNPPPPLHCDLCEDAPKAEFRCANCINHFCSRCRRSHDRLCQSPSASPIPDRTRTGEAKSQSAGRQGRRPPRQMLEKVLKRVAEEEKKLALERKDAERRINDCYTSLLSHATEARDASLRSLREAATALSGTLMETAALAREALNKAGDTSAGLDPRDDLSGEVLADSTLRRFEEMLQKGVDEPVLRYNIFTGENVLLKKFLGDFMSTVVAVAAADPTDDGNSSGADEGDSQKRGTSQVTEASAQQNAGVLNKAASPVEDQGEGESVDGPALLREIASLREELTSQRQELTSQRQELTSQRQELVSIKDEGSPVSQENRKLRSDVTSLQTDHKKLQSDHDQLRADCTQLKENLTHLGSDRDQLQTYCNQLKTDWTHLRSDHDQLQTDCNQLKEDVTQLGSHRDQLQTVYNQFKTDLTQLGSNHDQLQTDCNQLKENLTQLASNHDQLQTDCNQLKEDITQLRSNHDQLQTDCNQFKTDLTQLGSNHDQLQTDCNQLKEDVTQLRSNHDQLRTDCNQFKEDVTQLRSNHDQLRTDCNQLKENLTQLGSDRDQADTRQTRVQGGGDQAQSNVGMDQDRMVSHVQTLRATVGQLEDMWRKDRLALAALESRLNKLNHPVQVAFHVFLTTTLTLTHAQTVVCDYVFTNAGDAYSPVTGAFTAPVAGLYCFLASSGPSSKDASKRAALHIKIGDEDVAYLGAVGRGMATAHCAVRVQAGEQVRLQSFHGLSEEITLCRAFFSGVLLHAG